MLITLSRRAAICQAVAEVQLTGLSPLGVVSHRFNFNLTHLLTYISLFIYFYFPFLLTLYVPILIACLCVYLLIMSIKSIESMECMYEKVSRQFTACPVTLLRFALRYVTFCGIHRNIMQQALEMYLGREIKKQHGHEKY